MEAGRGIANRRCTSAATLEMSFFDNSSRREVLRAVVELYRKCPLLGALFTCDIYDLGLAAEQRTHVQEWDRTSVFKTSITDIPLVGWKFAVVLDALTRHAKVLWCDANAELRRPLTAIRHALNEKGYFLTVAGHRFPTPKTVRPATLQHFDCQAAFASRQECTSAYLGVVRGSRYMACSLP